jgi:hypothetical protein
VELADALPNPKNPEPKNPEPKNPEPEEPVEPEEPEEPVFDPSGTSYDHQSDAG